MDIPAWQRRLDAFSQARAWPPYQTPKNLAMAMMVESAELLELFQWLTPEESTTLTANPEDHERVGDEMADVLLYLFQLAAKTGVDLDAAVERKFAKNALKYPAPA